MEILILIASGFYSFFRHFQVVTLLSGLFLIQGLAADKRELKSQGSVVEVSKQAQPAQSGETLSGVDDQGGFQPAGPAGVKKAKSLTPLQPLKLQKQMAKFPRWRLIQRYRQAMREKKKIWVVAKTRDSDAENYKEELYVASAGMAKASVGQAYLVLKDFSGWTSLSDYVLEAEFDEEKSVLFLHLNAYGYYAKMHMDVVFGGSDQYRDLYMKVVRGHFLGMTVGFRIQKDAKSRKSEILMTALHPFEKLPLPRFFMEFGLEVVFQQLGQRLRSRMERGLIGEAQK
ncbi:MAG: hypothetical protein HRT45_10425 [Bdellovibrionales bacterium]|nr:hypothetical protein [Bdellovibrionales bacterium]